jgi:hypothetical protein
MAPAEAGGDTPPRAAADAACFSRQHTSHTRTGSAPYPDARPVRAEHGAHTMVPHSRQSREREKERKGNIEMNDMLAVRKGERCIR